MIATKLDYFSGMAESLGFFNPIFSMIGNTPLLPLPYLTDDWKSKPVYAKAEWYNPGGSVKDRAAANMILQALWRGEFEENKALLDATSGNTGIAYAMLGAILGLRVELFVPENISELKKKILRAYGAILHFSEASESSDGAIRRAKAHVQKHPDKYVYLDQYSNPDNWKAHYYSTGAEILQQTDFRITHFVSGLGTTGTFVGTARRLRQEKPEVELIAVQPDFCFHGIEGLKRLDAAIVPPIYEPSLVDRHEFVSTEEAQEMARLLARRYGLLVGTSSAAAAVVARRVAANIERGVIVTIFPDSGIKYVEEKYWE